MVWQIETLWQVGGCQLKMNVFKEVYDREKRGRWGSAGLPLWQVLRLPCGWISYMSACPGHSSLADLKTLQSRPSSHLSHLCPMHLILYIFKITRGFSGTLTFASKNIIQSQKYICSFLTKQCGNGFVEIRQNQREWSLIKGGTLESEFPLIDRV